MNLHTTVGWVESNETQQSLALVGLLSNVLQLIDDGFNGGTLAEHQTIVEGHESLFHLALRFGDAYTAALRNAP